MNSIAGILSPDDLNKFNKNNKLTKLIKLSNKYPALINIIKDYYEENPSEINKVDCGLSPLYAAVLYGGYNNVKLVKFLLMHGADINAIHNVYGVHSALVSRFKLLKLMCDFGFALHCQDSYGNTILEKAMAINSSSFVNLIHEYANSITLLNAKN